MNAKAEIVPRSTIARLAQDRLAALSQMDAAADQLKAAWEATQAADEVARRAAGGSRYVGSSYQNRREVDHLYNSDWDKAKAFEQFKRGLDQNIWTHLIEVAGVNDLMDREAKEALEKSLIGDGVPEATEENMRATVETLFKDSDMIFKRGLANCFSALDRRFRSHDGFKIGSRIILQYVFDSWGSFQWSSRIAKTICDVERVFAVLDGNKPNGTGLLRAIDNSRGRGMDPRQSECESDYFRILGYKNGNAHLWFTRDDLVQKANKILAEWYGDVLGDADPDGKPEDMFNRSSVPAKDLQFFASPDAVVDTLIEGLQLDGKLVLEPSAGTGAIAFAAAKKGARVTAIELDLERYLLLEAKANRTTGVDTRFANFLNIMLDPVYEVVLMNPPFYGTHYMDHITQAMKFLAPGGILRAVVPASAEVNESAKHIAFRKWCQPYSDGGWRGPFEDLPDGSFREAGTNINTCILRLRNKR